MGPRPGFAGLLVPPVPPPGTPPSADPRPGYAGLHVIPPAAETASRPSVFLSNEMQIAALSSAMAVQSEALRHLVHNLEVPQRAVANGSITLMLMRIRLLQLYGCTREHWGVQPPKK